MDKRKGIILAIVLFLIIGLGTFVFAGGSEENGNGSGNNTNNPSNNNDGNGGQDTPSENNDDGETEEEGGQSTNNNGGNTITVGGNSGNNATRPAGGNNNTDGDELVTDGEGENNPTTPTVDYKALLDELANMVEKATSKNDLRAAEQFREDNNITEENIATLNDETASETYEDIIAILTDNDLPVVTPADLNDNYFNEAVEVSISDATEVKYTLTLNGEDVTETADLANLSDEGKYVLTVRDAAFNEVVVTFTVDNTDPLLLVNDEKVEDGEIIYVNESAKMTVDETNLESFTSNGHDRTENVLNGSWTAQNDGTYNIVVTDKAGNETTYTIVVDKTAPEVGSTDDRINDGTYHPGSVPVRVSDANLDSITVNGEKVEFEGTVWEEKFTANGTYEIIATDKAGNSETFTFTVDKKVPVLVINDEVINETDETLYYNENAKISVKEDNLESFIVNGNDRTESVLNGGWTASGESGYTVVVTDKAGNTATYKIVVDKTEIEVNHLYILNNSHNDYEVSDDVRYKVIGNGQDLYVELVLKEQFDSVPEITVGNSEPVEMSCNMASWDKNLWKCDAHITITEDMGFENGNEITFDITGVKDLAGNETTVTEADVTVTDKYGKVIYDNEAPEYNQLGILNVDHLRNDEDITVANIGDEIRVLFHFTEELAVNPKMTVGESKTVYELELNENYDNFSKYTYVADITLTEDMNLADGSLVYTIYGYADAANNVGKTIKSTDDDLKVYNKFPGVKIDTTAPVYRAMGILPTSTYITNGDKITVNVQFNEKLAVAPTLTIAGVEETIAFNNGIKRGTEEDPYWVYSAYYTLSEEDTIADGKLKFTVSGYADVAGNVGEDLTEESKMIGGQDELIVDRTNPSVKFPSGHNYNKYYNIEYLTITITEENLTEVYYTWSKTNSYQTASNKVAEENILDNGDGTYSVKIPTIEGRYKLNIKAVDIVGNTTEVYSSSANYNIDRTKPVVTLYKWSADGNHQEIEPSGHNYCVLVDATDNNLASITLNGTSYTNKEIICNDGNYELIATDKAGLSETINFEIDRTYGTVTINGTDKYNTYDLDNIHKYNKIDSIEFSEEGNVRLSLNDEVVYFGSTEEFNYTFVDGLYKVELFDNAGNPTVVMFELDSTAPQVVELRINSSNDDKSYANETHSVGIYLTVDEKLASDPVFTIDGKVYNKNQGDEEKNFYAVVTNLPADTTEGELNFTIEVEDEFGNIATFTNEDIKNNVGYDKVIFDTTAPELTLVGTEETYDNILRIEAGTEITLEDVLATATDASFGGEVVVEPYEVNFYANTGLKDDNIYGYDFSNGFDTRKPTGSRYNIYYKVTDKAGNTTEDVMILAIADTTAAVITENQEDNYHVEYGSEYTPVTATVTDNVDETDYEYEPWEYIRFDFQFNNLGEVYYNNTFDTTKPGRYLAIWDYTDSSGNVSNTLKRWVIVSDTTAPDLNVSTIENGYLISPTSQIYATDLQEFNVVIKSEDGKVLREDVASISSVTGLYTVSYKLFDDSLADGKYTIEATDAANNVSKLEFSVDRFDVIESKVSSNLIDEANNTINNFNSFAVKFDKDLVFEYGSTDKTYTISFEYSTDGVNYKDASYKISNWPDSLVKDPYSNPTERYLLNPSVTISAGSPIYWSGTNVGSRWTEIYDAILATKETNDKVYVRTIFTVVQPTYTKSFELGEVVYSKGGTEVSERGLADFN